MGMDTGTSSAGPDETGVEDPVAVESNRMIARLEAAVAAYEAGQIDAMQLQQRCLAAGTARVGNAMLIWDWTNGRLYGFDGFRVSVLYETGA